MKRLLFVAATMAPWATGCCVSGGHSGPSTYHPKKVKAGRCATLPAVEVSLDRPGENVVLTAQLSLVLKRAPDEQMRQARERIHHSRAELTSWQIVYLSGLKPDQAHGSENLEKIRRDAATACNKLLWPAGGGQVEEVLLLRFLVQYGERRRRTMPVGG